MKHLSSLLFFLTIALSLTAQEKNNTTRSSAADYFSRAPIEVASGLPEYSRLDMIDYFNHGSSVKTENRLGQKVSIRSISPEKLVYTDDDSISTTIALLPFQKLDTIIMVIRTLPMPAPDSKIYYFDKNWRQIGGSVFPNQSIKDWLTTSDRKVRSAVESELPFMISTADYDPETTTLTFTNTTDGYFADGQKPEVLNNLKPEIKYKWDGRKFRLVAER